MKLTIRRITVAVAVLLGAATQSFAIEGLRMSVQGPDVVLGWPSSSEETYIVQWRPSLSPSTPWVTLTDWLPAASSTNWTVFVDSNRIQSALPGNENMMMSSGAVDLTELSLLDSMIALALRTSQPLVVQNDGSGVVLPLGVYPPGTDLSAFTIFEPSSGESVPGAGYIVSQPSFNRAQLNDSETAEDDPADPPPDPGFYRVVRDGAHLVGITNNMTLSGVVTIPVEVGAAEGTLVALSVREDGSPVGNSPAVAPFGLPLQVVLDTTAMSNGVHEISGFASWRPVGDEDSGSSVDAESPVVSVNVYNEITFPGWIEHYGELYDAVLITAQSAHADADWWVDIYGSNAGYIGTFSGHTTDGNIYGWWNLTRPPPTYTSYAGESYFDFVVTTEYNDGQAARGNNPQPQSLDSATSVPKRTYKQTDNWTTKGMWVVANMQAWEGALGHENLDTATDGFVLAAEINSLTVRPNHPYGEAFRVGYGSDIPVATRNAQWSALRSALFHQESRNFFYLGHGAPDGIGASDNPNRFITAAEIAGGLFTIPAGQANRHAYRFVFLYGCETASGTLPESFGMLHRENVPGIDFANAALTPNAYVGWNQNEAAAIAGSALMDNVFFLQHFQYEWSQANGVHEALRRAKNNYSDVGLINFSKVKVFGNWDLTYWGFNR